MIDRRYKITKNDVIEMRKLRERGIPYKKIAQMIGNEISWSTVYYWCNDKHRQKQREVCRHRRKTPEENRKRNDIVNERRKARHKIHPEAKLAHEIRCALSDDRTNRKSVRGIPLEKAEQLLKSGALSLKSRKID